MRSRKRWSSVLGAAAVVAVLAVIAAGCGSSNKKSASSTSSSGSNSGKTFDTLHVVWGDTDYMDPGLSYRLESWQLFQNIYEGLVARSTLRRRLRPTSSRRSRQSLPTSSSDASDYKFTLRKGLKYSNGKPVKASDFPATIVRDFNMNSPGVGLLLEHRRAPTGARRTRRRASRSPGLSRTTRRERSRSSCRSRSRTSCYVDVAAVLGARAEGHAGEAADEPASALERAVRHDELPAAQVVRDQAEPQLQGGSIPTVPQGNPDQVIGTITDDLAASAQKVISGSADYDENLLPTDRL